MKTAWHRRPSVLLALALCSVGGVVTLLGRLATGPKPEPKHIALAGGSGAKAYPSFSPDGQRIAYSRATATGDEKPEGFHIFVRAAAPDSPRQLTAGDGNDVAPAWSPDGHRIAFLRLSDGRAQYLVVPAAGGAERQIAEFANERDASQPLPAVAWTAGGKSLVVVDTSQTPPALASVPLDEGAPVRLTNPPPQSAGDSTPAVSPDGSTLAFVRSTSAEGGDIYLCGLRANGPCGPARRLTFDDSAIHGLTWADNGQDVTYAAERAGNGSQIWRLPAYGGSPRQIAAAGIHAAYPSASGTGNRLVYTDSPNPTAIWRARLDPPPDGAGDQPFIHAGGSQSWPVYSPNGKRIAYISDQTGKEEIWSCDADGGRPVQVTHVVGEPRLTEPKWAPDNTGLLFTYAGPLGRGIAILSRGKSQVTLIAMGGGEGSWSRDGKTIYFDKDGRVWRMPAMGGAAEAVTRALGTSQGVESEDGKFVYFRHRRSIWRVPVNGGEEQGVFVPDYPLWTGIQPAGNGLYYLQWAFGNMRAQVLYYDLAAKQSSVTFRMKSSDARRAPAYSISPDREYIIYPRIDRNETDLMILENFR